TRLSRDLSSDVCSSDLFVGGQTVPDILYSSDHWLQQWAAAGWVVPLEDYFPEAAQVKETFAPYAVEGMTYNGKLYGFPYFADPKIGRAAWRERMGNSAR